MALGKTTRVVGSKDDNEESLSFLAGHEGLASEEHIWRPRIALQALQDLKEIELSNPYDCTTKYAYLANSKRKL